MDTISDSKLFVRLPINHEWRTLSPSGLREVIVKRLGVSPASFGLIKPVRTGFALSPCCSKAREALLQISSRLLNTGAKIEPASNWVPLIVPTEPRYISTLEGQIEVTKEILANCERVGYVVRAQTDYLQRAIFRYPRKLFKNDTQGPRPYDTNEIERVTSIRPASVRLYDSLNQVAPHRIWMAFFTKASRSGFRVFDESGKVTISKEQKAIYYRKRCIGYHPSRNCSLGLSCGNFGSAMHNENDCKTLKKCKNRGGPHRSDSHKYLARATRSGGPTNEQLKTFCTVGERENQAVAREKAAEQRASHPKLKF
ncbi:putative eka-like protein [Erysiphe necator]|uniref:Putative eka-like protein n=1 Tax=Uncinula necator TaxID=52586 RepID=A0A0B1NUN4_UNCNE|nr:putative eka-like protein [Erysiphe necator]